MKTATAEKTRTHDFHPTVAFGTSTPDISSVKLGQKFTTQDEPGVYNYVKHKAHTIGFVVMSKKIKTRNKPTRLWLRLA